MGPGPAFVKLGFLGLGRLGGAMAARLLAHGQAVKVYDPVPALVQRLVSVGAEPARDLAALCEGVDVVITMLPSDQSLLAATLGDGGLEKRMARGAIHMLCGTHGIGAVEAVGAAHSAGHQTLVVCSVLGRPDRAAEGKLGLIPAGPPEAVAALHPILTILGDTVFEASSDPLSSTALKIANNFVLGCAIEAMGEGMALARKYGADPALFYAIMTQGLFDCVAYRAYGDVIAQEDWGRVGAAATIGLKDADLALEAASRMSISLPSLSAWRDHLTAAIERGEAGLDWAVMAREQFRQSGLE